MRSVVLTCVLMCCLLSRPLVSVAANEVGDNVVSVAAIEVPFLLEKEGRGDFYDLLKMIELESGLVFDVRIGPGLRVREWFDRGEVDVLTPAIASSMTVAHIRSSAFFNKEILAFTTKQPALTKLSDLRGKTVGYTRGYSYRPALLSEPDTDYQGINSDEQNLLMLFARRLDVFIGEPISVLQKLQKMRLADEVKSTEIIYAADQPLTTESVYFAFQPNARGEYLRQKYEAALVRLRQQGRLHPPLF